MCVRASAIIARNIQSTSKSARCPSQHWNFQCLGHGESMGMSVAWSSHSDLLRQCGHSDCNELGEGSGPFDPSSIERMLVVGCNLGRAAHR